jgi:hypothetical protein
MERFSMNAVTSAVRANLRTVVVRASALPDFFDCPARAEAKHILGKKMPTSGKALLGKAIHKSTAVYDESRLTGAGITMKEAAAAAVDVIHKPDEEVALDDDLSVSDMERIALNLHGRYCLEIATTQEYHAVEVRCERVDITDIGLALTGTTDRVRKVDGGLGIADLKSGKTAVRADGRVETKGAAYQLGVYEILAEQALGLSITRKAQIIGLQTGKTPAGQRVGTGEMEHPREVLIGEPGVPGILESLAHMIHAGNFPGNPRSMLCGEKYCPIYSTCKYRK